MENFRARIEANLLKAVREAKVNTSWIQRNEEYETALVDFVRALLAPGENAFLNDFRPSNNAWHVWGCWTVYRPR
jgi:(1->4)-alpha-D-glucan 1-alpha-D-glucosylmutase